jgi:hypothetical protein
MLQNIKIFLILLLIMLNLVSTRPVTSCPVTPPYSHITDFLPTAPVSANEVSKAIKSLKPFKCDGLHGIPQFFISGCFEIFIPFLT